MRIITEYTIPNSKRAGLVLEFEISAYPTNDNNVDPDGVFADVLAFTKTPESKKALTVITIAIGLLAVAGHIKVGNIADAIKTAKLYFGAAGYVRT